MNKTQFTKNAKNVALANGADLVGVVKAKDLPEHTDDILRILPSAKSIMVIVSKHSFAAISSDNNQVAQFDTINAYDECAKAAHATTHFLQSEGFSSVAVPAFIPIDMEKPKYGMRGEICWRRAGVRAGLGSYGENGLLITPELGAAVRISGVITSYDLQADSPLKNDVCDHCMACVEACSTGALSGEGKIDKKLCGDEIFKFGFRFFKGFIQDLARENSNEAEKIIEGEELLEMWQTFMTGNYYYCFRCQSQCPGSKFL